MPHELTEDTEVRKTAGALEKRAPVRYVLWALGIAIAAVFWLIPLESMPYSCFSRVLTSVPCPTCGTGRALHSLLHARIAQCLAYHPLVIPGVVFAALWIATGRSRPEIRRIRGKLTVPALLLWGIAVLVVWVYRLRLGTIP